MSSQNNITTTDMLYYAVNDSKIQNTVRNVVLNMITKENVMLFGVEVNFTAAASKNAVWRRFAIVAEDSRIVSNGNAFKYLPSDLTTQQLPANNISIQKWTIIGIDLTITQDEIDEGRRNYNSKQNERIGTGSVKELMSHESKRDTF